MSTLPYPAVGPLSTENVQPTEQRSVLVEANREQMAQFHDALFRYVDPGRRVAVRAFAKVGNADKPWGYSLWAYPPADDAKAVLDAAVRLATAAANSDQTVVFCPPVATFGQEDNAKTENLANGLALSV